MIETSYSTISSKKLYRWAAKHSLWTYNLGLSCCTTEFIAATGPRFDLDQFGSKWLEEPSNADLLLISGPITLETKDIILKIYEEMLNPKFVISMGSCANSGGIFSEFSTNIISGVDQVLPVDIYIPGCPPKPEAVISAIKKLCLKIESAKWKT